MLRLGHYALALWVAVTLNFALPRLMPGSPLALLAGTDLAALTAGQRGMLLAEAGLDRPVIEQYGRYLSRLARGDLGYSYQRARPVVDVMAERLPWTLTLAVISQIVALIMGLTLGVLAAARRGRQVDAALLTGVMIVDALPVFWVGMLLVAVFAVQVPIFPAFGATTVWRSLSGVSWLADVVWHLVLPLVTLVLASLAAPFLVARTAVSAALQEPFVTAARARGSSTQQIFWGHAVPNTLLPLTASGALGVASAIGGATLVETVFSYPGLGRLAYEAVLSRDYPVIQGVFLLTTTVVLIANALVDGASHWLDPRTPDRARGTS